MLLSLSCRQGIHLVTCTLITIISCSDSFESSPVLILDAGHMHVKSDIVNKEEKKKIQDSLASYTMSQLVQDIYDKFTIDFTSSKIMVANLDPNSDDFTCVESRDHFLENLDISLRLDVSILPNAPEFTKFKFSGSLPRLHLNVSEHKLVIIKRVGELLTSTFGASSSPSASTQIEKTPMELWREQGPAVTEAELMEALEDIDQPSSTGEKSEGASAVQTLFDAKFEFHQASVVLFESKSNGSGSISSPVALFEAQKIQVGIISKPNDTVCTASLGALYMQDLAPDANSMYKNLVAPDSGIKSETETLIKMDYHSVKSIDSNTLTDITVLINPVKFVLVRQCILKVYHVFMTLTGPAAKSQQSLLVEQLKSDSKVNITLSTSSLSTSTTSIHLKVRHIALILEDRLKTLGSCSLEGFDVSLNSTQDIMFMSGKIGKLSLVQDEIDRCILLIEEDKALDFEFETFDAERAKKRGFDSSLLLNATSWRFVYDPHYLSKIFTYFGQFQEMNAVMDRASKAAYETQQQIQSTAGKLYIQFNAKTPIIVVPNSSSSQSDSLIFYPGSITAETAEKSSNLTLVNDRFNIVIQSLKLQSAFYHPNGIQYSDMVQDVNLEIQYDTMVPIANIPLSYYNFKLSDINIRLTNHQYRLFAEIMTLVFTPDPNSQVPDPGTPIQDPPRIHTDLFVAISKLSFEAFNCPTRFDKPEKFSLAKLIGTAGSAKLSTKSNGPLDFELCFSSLSIIDTRQSNSAFRDIMIPLKEIHDQFVFKYHSSPRLTEYNCTIDRAKLILEVDHIFALRTFIFGAWYSDADRAQPQIPPDPDAPRKPFKGKVCFVEAEIIVIQEPENPKTDAVILTSKHLVIVQDIVLSVSFHDLGMSFCVMDKRKDTELRFLDDCSVLYTLDDRMLPDASFVYHISVETTKLLFRVSKRDTILLNDLVNRITSSGNTPPSSPQAGPVTSAEEKVLLESTAKPNISQKFYLSIESIQAFLIDDSNNLLMPLFEFGVERTIYEMTNWSSKFEFNLGLSFFANYFNIRNSHWEPMIESAQLSVNVR